MAKEAITLDTSKPVTLGNVRFVEQVNASRRCWSAIPAGTGFHTADLAALVLDPDGNNFAAVDHRPAKHFAASVKFGFDA